MSDLDLNINGDARRAQQALNDVATGAERAARITDHLARSYDNLEHEASQAQRRLEQLDDEINDTGPTAELMAELTELQRRLSDIGDERRGIQDLQGSFRRATAAAATLDHQLAATRRELDRLNDEYSRGGDPAVLRQIQEQQRELERLNGIRRRIQSEDEQNQSRLARLAEEALRAQARREDEARRRAEDEDNSSFLRRLRRQASNLGDSAGSGLQGAPVPPAALAVGGAIGAAAAVPLLAAIGGALTGIVGAGVAGAGVAGAIMGDPEKFKAEWAGAVGTLKSEFLGATEVFAGPTLDAIRGIGPLVKGWHLDAIFADAAKFVPVLVHGVEGLATGVVRGAAAMTAKGMPAVEALSDGLGELGDAAGDAFESIADGAEGGGEALGDLLGAVSNVVRGFGKVVGAAEDAYGFVHDHPIEATLATGGLALPIVLFDQFNDTAGQISGTLADLGTSGANAFYGLDQAERDALATQERLNTAWDDARETLLGVSNAAIAVEQDFDDLAEGFKKGANALDITTQKGRDNRELINQTISDLMRQRDAAIAAGNGSAEATAAANSAFNKQVQNLENLLVKLGMTRTAAHNLMNEFYDKTVTVTVKVKQVGSVSVQGVVAGGDQRRSTGSAYASGGEVTATGVSLVGERGPELRFMNRGDYVATAAETKAMLGGGGGGSGGVAVVRVILQYPDGQVIRDELVTTASNQGQTVSGYLGL